MDQTGSVKTVYFVRHGRTDWNIHRKLQGRDDIPLNSQGIEDAQRFKLYFQNIPLTRIVCSPLQRALETARMINQDHRLNLSTDSRLIEIDYGRFSGKNVETYWEAIIQEKLSGIESQAAIKSRMMQVFTEIVSYSEETILVISHSVALGMLFSELKLFNANQRLGHHEVIKIEIKNGVVSSWQRIDTLVPKDF